MDVQREGYEETFEWIDEDFLTQKEVLGTMALTIVTSIAGWSLHTSQFTFQAGLGKSLPDTGIMSQWRLQHPDQKRIGSDSWSSLDY